MSKEKDRNESTSFILRDFNVELLDKLKKFTGEKTASKAVMLICARYLGLEKLVDKQASSMNELAKELTELKELIRDQFIAEESIKRFIGIGDKNND